MKKRILIVTVGEQEKPLYEGLKRVKNIDNVYLLVSKFTEKYAEGIKEGISRIYDSEIIIINEKNLQETIKKIIDLHKKEKNGEFVYNITGGTKIMSAACHVVASFLGEEMFYIFKNKEGMEFVNVPVLKYNLMQIIDKKDKKYEILRILSQNKLILTALSDKLKLKKPTVLGHLDKLLRYNLIASEPNTKDYNITETGKIFLDLLEVCG